MYGSTWKPLMNLACSRPVEAVLVPSHISPDKKPRTSQPSKSRHSRQRCTERLESLVCMSLDQHTVAAGNTCEPWKNLVSDPSPISRPFNTSFSSFYPFLPFWSVREAKLLCDISKALRLLCDTIYLVAITPITVCISDGSQTGNIFSLFLNKTGKSTYLLSFWNCNYVCRRYCPDKK